MTLDERLLQRARMEGDRLAEAERQVLTTRGDYHTSVRRLHLAGASLREIAQALNLSHQRVQQIVRGAGGTWWQRVWRSRNAQRGAVCTFCDRPPSEVAKLIAGPNVFICDACVERAELALAHGDGGAFRVGSRVAMRCAFCGKLRTPARRMAASAAGNVCAACLAVCRQILDDRAA